MSDITSVWMDSEVYLWRVSKCYSIHTRTGHYCNSHRITSALDGRFNGRWNQFHEFSCILR